MKTVELAHQLHLPELVQALDLRPLGLVRVAEVLEHQADLFRLVVQEVFRVLVRALVVVAELGQVVPVRLVAVQCPVQVLAVPLAGAGLAELPHQH